MRSRFHYIRPQSLSEALEFLAANGSRTTILAGGTDLMIAIREGSVTADYVLDVSRLKELREISRRGDRIRVGAAAPYSEIIASPLIQEAAPLLAMAARCVGSVQIRNAGTLGGNVANASPAGDGIPPLIVHDALAEIRTGEEKRTFPVAELITGPYRTGLKPGELITAFLLEPLKPGCRISWQRVARRQSLSVARMNAAAMGEVDESGAVTGVKLSVGSVTPVCLRCSGAEQILLGKVPDEDLIERAARAVSEVMVDISGVRPTTEYKKPAVEGLVTKAFRELFLESEGVQR